VEEILKGQVIIRSRAFATFSATEFSRAACCAGLLYVKESEILRSPRSESDISPPARQPCSKEQHSHRIICGNVSIDSTRATSFSLTTTWDATFQVNWRKSISKNPARHSLRFLLLAQTTDAVL